MESAFGAGFGGVRVHTGAEADALSAALSARAFTAGQDIFFRRGEYAPQSSTGRQLLAHELTHVVQQGTHPAAPLSRLSVGEPGDRFEREADRVAEAMAGKEGSRLPATHSVRRAEEDDSPSVQLFRPEATARRHPSISAVSAPLVQRVATFNTGPVYTWNLASQAAAGGSYGQTLYELNGSIVYCSADLKAAIKGPAIGRRTTKAGEECWISSAPTNVATFTMYVPNNGPWKDSPQAKEAGRVLKLPVCMRPGQTRFTVYGVPSDTEAATKVEKHEEVHANIYEGAFDTQLGSWDAQITKNIGRVFTGRDTAECEAKLFAAVGGTPDEIATNMNTYFSAGNKAFHKSHAGRVVRITNGRCNDTCAVSWGYFGP